jgi:hypothetical protein
MKRRKWTLLALLVFGIGGFVLSRTVWGPPSKAAAAEAPMSPELTESERRYIQDQPHHWRYVMLKQN